MAKITLDSTSELQGHLGARFFVEHSNWETPWCGDRIYLRRRWWFDRFVASMEENRRLVRADAGVAHEIAALLPDSYTVVLRGARSAGPVPV